MPRRIVILQGHPDAAEGHLCRALADAYRAGAESAGHAVSCVDIARLAFPLLRTQDDFEHGSVPEALRPANAAIKAADHIVLIFPLWLGTMPALVKGFLEQVMRPGEAFAYQDTGLPRSLLKGKSARIVVTMGMPALAYRWWFGAYGVRGLERSILNFVGIRPVRESFYGMVTTASPRRRQRWLDEMHRLGRRAN